MPTCLLCSRFGAKYESPHFYVQIFPCHWCCHWRKKFCHTLTNAWLVCVRVSKRFMYAIPQRQKYDLHSDNKIGSEVNFLKMHDSSRLVAHRVEDMVLRRQEGALRKHFHTGKRNQWYIVVEETQEDREKTLLQENRVVTDYSTASQLDRKSNKAKLFRHSVWLHRETAFWWTLAKNIR